MVALWGVKNHVGEVLQDFTATSRIEVGRKLVPTRYDAFRLQCRSRTASYSIARSRAFLIRSTGRSCAWTTGCGIFLQPRRLSISAMQKRRGRLAGGARRPRATGGAWRSLEAAGRDRQLEN